jgi:hypothetical protein
MPPDNIINIAFDSPKLSTRRCGNGEVDIITRSSLQLVPPMQPSLAPEAIRSIGIPTRVPSGLRVRADGPLKCDLCDKRVNTVRPHRYYTRLDLHPSSCRHLCTWRRRLSQEPGLFLSSPAAPTARRAWHRIDCSDTLHLPL